MTNTDLDMDTELESHSLAKEIMIGPHRMNDISNHTAKNIAMITVLALMLSVSIPVLAGGLNFSVIGSGIITFLTTIFIGVFGFFVSLSISKISATENSKTIANKWASYCVVSFIFTIGAFIVLALYFLFAGNSDYKSPVDYLTTQKLWSYELSAYLVTLFCSFLGTSLLFLLLFFGKRIKETPFISFLYYSSTIFVSSLTMYLTHFVL